MGTQGMLDGGTTRLSRRGRLALFGAVVATVLVVVAGMGTMAWGDGLRDGEQLLPGTTIAGVDVGGRTVGEAAGDVADVVDASLDQPLTITAEGGTWTTTPRDLGATSDLDAVVAEAFERTRTAGLGELARLRLGLGGLSGLHVTLDVPDAAVADLVATIATEVDRAPVDAGLAWTDGHARVRDAVVGRRVVRDHAATAVEDALLDGAGTVALPVEAAAPAFDTEAAAEVAARVDENVASALGRSVTIALDGDETVVTAGELGVGHDAPDLLARRGQGPLNLSVPDAVLAELVDRVEDGHEYAARDAELDWTAASGFTQSAGATGRAVDDEAAAQAIRGALLGATDRVELTLETTTPDVTTDDFDEVLLVRQGERRVELYRDGQVVRGWDVAVGTSGHPTPTGMFTIGAKRFEPTWRNSSPDGWGSDMPLEIGPGPDNPLGLRALNWMDGPVDTLIRFHGTQNVASIGNAASHGCVRMRNEDVVELYDLVDSGTVIVSTHG